MANDIEGMIAELGALNVENGKMFDNIKDGLGKDPKDTKKTEKQKSNKELKDLDDTLERYHEINDVLDDIIKGISANGIIRPLCIMGGEPLCEENSFLTYLIIE